MTKYGSFLRKLVSSVRRPQNSCVSNQTPDSLPSLQPSSLTAANHVIWLQSEGSHSPFLPMSLFHSLSLSQSSTVEQNVRLWSGKCQYVLAGQLDFEAAQRPALNQRASLCSALTKIYPGQQKNTSKNKTNSSVPARGGGASCSPTRSVQVEELPELEVTNKTW